MDIQLTSLATLADDFLFAWGSAQFRHWSGIEKDVSLRRVLRDFPTLRDHEALRSFLSPLKNASADDERRALARWWLMLAERHHQAEFVDPLRQVIHPRSSAPSALSMMQELELEMDRGKREVLGRTLIQRLASTTDALARRWDATQTWAQKLEWSSFGQLQETTAATPMNVWYEHAEAFLKQTKDAYLDVLHYVAKKNGADAKPGQLEWHDVIFASGAAGTQGSFERKKLIDLVQRNFEDIGVPLQAHGRVSLNVENTPLRVPGAYVAPLRVPDDVRIAAELRPGMKAYREFWFTAGRALHWAHVTSHLDAHKRWLNDEAVNYAYGSVTAGFLTEPLWFRRYLGVSAMDATEMARMSALSFLVELRALSAQLLWHRELGQQGWQAGSLANFSDRFSDAMGSKSPPALAVILGEVDNKAFDRLRGWALGELLRDTMRQKFDEDYFRNPAMAGYWKETAAWGQQWNADERAQQLSQTKLSLAQLGTSLIKKCG